MATSVVFVRCPGCGVDRRPHMLGLAEDGHFDAARAQPNELSERTNTYRGRARIDVERHDLPLPTALGLRQMLRYRLSRVEEELRAAGVELDD